MSGAEQLLSLVWQLLVFTGFIAGRPGWIQKTQAKWWNVDLSVLFTTVTALWTLVTLLIKLFRRLFRANTCKTKIMPFWPLCCENEAIWFIKFRPGHRVGVFIWKNFHPGYHDLGRKTRGRSASHMNTLIFLQRKEWLGKISETEPARLIRLIWKGP